MAAMLRESDTQALSSLLCICIPREQDVQISGIALDSRKITAGDLFLALPGEIHDGRQFIEQAVANGASAVVAQAPVAGFVDEVSVPLIEMPELQREVGPIAARFYANPSHDLRLVGVTGTNGKTTTCHLLAQLVRLRGKTCGVIGTLGASLDGTFSGGANTTPDAVSLQQQLAQWRDGGVFAVGMEVSSHALVQGRVCGIQFETAIFTNLSRDHLDYHGSMAAYGRAKVQLFAMEGLRHAVVNLDDEYAENVLAAIPPGVKTLTYSVRGNDSADVVFANVRFHEAGVRAALRTPWGAGECASPLPGEFNLSNLAAALAAMLLADQDIHGLLDAVSKLQPVPGRMQLIPNRAGLQLVVDYAHTPAALEQVIAALRPHVSGRLVTVFGCGGDRDRSKRAVMGRVASELSDRTIVTTDNPRSENPLAIALDIESGCTGEISVVLDRAQAIREAISMAVAGDCVLVAGKGHENYQIVDGERLFFSDEQQIELALRGRS